MWKLRKNVKGARQLNKLTLFVWRELLFAQWVDRSDSDLHRKQKLNSEMRLLTKQNLLRPKLLNFSLHKAKTYRAVNTEKHALKANICYKLKKKVHSVVIQCKGLQNLVSALRNTWK